MRMVVLILVYLEVRGREGKEERQKDVKLSPSGIEPDVGVEPTTLR